MPAVANRASYERRIAAALKKCRGQQREELLRLLGTPPDLRRVPDTFWKKAEECERDALLLFLPVLFVAGWSGIAERIGFDMPRADLEQRAAEWAELRANQLAKEAVANSKALARAKLRELLRERGRSAKPSKADFEPIFGETRAESAGITETTGSHSAGEMDGAREARKLGTEVQILWVTELDGAVCSLCRPLHLQPEDVWVIRYPDGPPAHPRCRCELMVDGKRFRPDVGRNPVS